MDMAFACGGWEDDGEVEVAEGEGEGEEEEVAACEGDDDADVGDEVDGSFLAIGTVFAPVITCCSCFNCWNAIARFRPH